MFYERREVIEKPVQHTSQQLQTKERHPKYCPLVGLAQQTHDLLRLNVVERGAVGRLGRILVPWGYWGEAWPGVCKSRPQENLPDRTC